MSVNILYIFVEGDDDERFFKAIISPLFQSRYTSVEIFKYAQWKKDKVDAFLKSIVTLQFDYIFAGDLDFSPHIMDKKHILKHKFTALDNERMIIVITEIESWYLAGLDFETTERFKIHYFENTDKITKEEFNLLYHNRFRSRIDFMTEVLKNYSIEAAKHKNESFKYFYHKYINPDDKFDYPELLGKRN